MNGFTGSLKLRRTYSSSLFVDYNVSDGCINKNPATLTFNNRDYLESNLASPSYGVESPGYEVKHKPSVCMYTKIAWSNTYKIYFVRICRKKGFYLCKIIHKDIRSVIKMIK